MVLVISKEQHEKHTKAVTTDCRNGPVTIHSVLPLHIRRVLSVFIAPSDPSSLKRITSCQFQDANSHS